MGEEVPFLNKQTRRQAIKEHLAILEFLLMMMLVKKKKIF